MEILIRKQNQNIIKQILPDVKFTESTKTTCTFIVYAKTFGYLINEVRLLGYNPYSLMTWGI